VSRPIPTRVAVPIEEEECESLLLLARLQAGLLVRVGLLDIKKGTS